MGFLEEQDLLRGEPGRLRYPLRSRISAKADQ
jgi:hypothetical protein